LLCCLQVFYYSTGIFESAGLNKEQAEFTLLGSGLVNFFMCCSSMYLTHRFPRRPLMFISTGGIVVFLIVLTVAIKFIVCKLANLSLVLDILRTKVLSLLNINSQTGMLNQLL
jgi:Sugar (and other) transporter